MNNPKYKIGDRFIAAGAEYEIIRAISATEPVYIFQNCHVTALKSVITESELDLITKNN